MARTLTLQKAAIRPVGLWWLFSLLPWLLFCPVVSRGQGRGPVLVHPAEVHVTATNAIIRWTTDVATGTRTHLGTTPQQLNRRVDGSLGTQHEVLLQDLAPGTSYYVAYGTARIRLGTNQFTTLGTASIPTTGPPGSWAATQVSRPTNAIAPAKAPPTQKTWGNMAALQDHFDRHGRDFGAKNPDDYAAQAWLFLQRARAEGLPAKRDSTGVVRVYDPATRAFAAYNRNGTTKTYFKPGRRDYFEDQPGTPVTLKATE